VKNGFKVSHFMAIDTVVSILISALGDIEAYQRALREQRNARRARSRKRYEFWLDVASSIQAQGRTTWAATCLEAFSDVDLAFFDPDNGVEMAARFSQTLNAKPPPLHERD